MKKSDKQILKDIFPEGQLSWIMKSIVKTIEVNPNLKIAILKIGTETNVLLYGQDANENNHITLLSRESFEKLKKIKLKGV